MLETLEKRPAMEHASNLGAPIAYAIAKAAGIKAYIYDSVRTDELIDIARISGMQKSQGLALAMYLIPELWL